MNGMASGSDLQPSVQLSRSVVSNSLWLHGLQHASCPVHHQLLKLAQTHVHLNQWCRPTISSSDAHFSCPQVFPSINIFSSESVLCIRWPKYWSFRFSISPSNEYSWLISFRIDWFDFLAVQGTLKSLLQHHSLKASILWCSAFFIVQFSHPYTTTGKK